jgi:tetratricopeptide (TPR) repeat protein
MQSLFFWKTWIKEYRLTWYALAILFIFSVIFFWFSQSRGINNVVHWDKIQEQKVIETTVHRFKLGPLTLDVPADSYVIFEYFNGSGVEPNTTASYLFLALLIASAVVLITFMTTLEGFWFFGGMAFVIFFLVGLRLEVVGLFGFYDRVPLAVIVGLFVAPGFYFNRFRPATPFLIRLLYFSVLTVAIGLCITFYSAVEMPMYHLSITAYIPALIIALLFIFMVAHEVFAFFIYVVNESSTKSLRHFSIIAFIYFLYLLVTSLHELGVIDWNFLYVNAYFLLSLSAILGIWGFRNREPLYGDIFSFYPLGAYFFLAMGIICFATLGQLAGNANDPALRILRHGIIFSHTGYGLIFLTYVFSNFILMMARNIGVYKVLYQPNRMPYFTYRFAGTIAMLAFVLVAGWREYVDNGAAGFYNFTAGLYALERDEKFTATFYEQSQQHGFLNHQANYALGTMRGAAFDFERAREDYHDANVANPSPYSLINSGNLFLWEGQPLEAIVSYRSAGAAIPQSGPLWNNLGFAFAKVHNLDSAVHYLNKAREMTISRTSAETNFFALAAAEFIPFKSDSIFASFKTNDSGTAANAIALATLFKEPFRTPVDPLQDERLNIHSATLLNNYIIHHATSLDTAFTRKAMAIASDEINAEFREALKASLAYGYYHQGNVYKALEILAEQVFLSQSYQGKFNYIMGLWALEQRNPEIASTYFTYANTFDYKDARFYNAIALTEARAVSEALMAWDSVSKYEGDNERAIAARMKNILTLRPEEVGKLRDAEVYQFCRYRVGLGDSVLFERMMNTFDNTNYKAQALLDISQRHYASGDTPRAIHYFNRIAGLELTDTTLYNSVRHFELLMLASRKELALLASQINKGITFGPERFLEKVLYTALMTESSGDTARANMNYKILATYNPYFEEGILAAAEYYKKEQKDFKSYSILAEAIHVNTNSRRLLEAYIEEALRLGFDSYAATAMEQLQGLRGGE